MKGERLWNMERLYNLAAGISGEEDRLPERCFEVPADFPADQKPLTREDFNALLQDYYRLRGWNEHGVPTAERLKMLEL